VLFVVVRIVVRLDCRRAAGFLRRIVLGRMVVVFTACALSAEAGLYRCVRGLFEPDVQLTLFVAGFIVPLVVVLVRA
jgi:hypothetical protein